MFFDYFREEKRLSTAPIHERPKHTDLYKKNNMELPILKGKNNPKSPYMDVGRGRSQENKKQTTMRRLTNDHKHPRDPEGTKSSIQSIMRRRARISS